ncbi:MAG TPA: NfeD family protein [Deferrimonas sp.]|jgi:hypothetical protein
MSFTLLYWHWLALGMILIIAELFVPSFTIFWFGLGAVLVALLLLLFPTIPLTGQLLCFALASGLFTWLWFRYLRPLMTDRTKAGLSREAALGESGQVVKAPLEGQRGVVRFTIPLLGNDEWPFICQTPTAVGDRVIVREISGNTLIVEKR